MTAESAAPKSVAYAYAAMAATTLASTVLPVPVYVHMMVMAMGTIHIGSYSSMTKEMKEAGETMETKDVYMFPVIGSAVLFSLYLVFKFCPKEWVTLVVKAYFFVIGTFVLGQKLSQIGAKVLPQPVVKSLTAKEFKFTVPFFTQTVAPKKGADKKEGGDSAEPEKEPIVVEFTTLDVLTCIVGAVFGVIYLKFNHWTSNNLFGVAFSIQGIELLDLGSYFNGAVLLSGLFFYDIFWVFGTDVMVTVAKKFDAPIKLLFPTAAKPSMLGLGDIVIPGIFIALMLRYDHYCHKLEKKEGPVKPAYYNVVMVGYGIGLTATLVVMYYFNAAQPALLYLVPACLLSTMGLALKEGKLKQLLEYKEENEDSQKEEPKKDK